MSTIQNVANKVADTVIDTFCSLACRWEDEHEYEDIDDYKAPIVEILKDITEVEVVEMTKRPFGFKWAALGRTLWTKVKGNQVVTEEVIT